MHARSNTGSDALYCQEVFLPGRMSKMDARQKAILRVACALICSESRKKRKKKRVWVKEWLDAPGPGGLSVLRKEVETHGGFCELMTTQDWDLLLEMVEPHITKKNTKMRLAISPRERLYLTLRFLATGETFRCLRIHFKMGTSTISQIVLETCSALFQVLNQDFLKMPSTQEEWRSIAREFELKWHFPHCTGALGGRHISIQPPGRSRHPDNHRGSLLVLMAAVDAHCKFIYATVDAQAEPNLPDFPPPEPLPHSDVLMPYMFVADGAFPLRDDVMMPYPLPQTDHPQRVLNYRLLRAQRVAENAFGVLANRLRVLRSIICLEPEKVVKITMAALCLHNFLCKRGSEAYTPPAFADWETAEHNIVEGAWRSHGTGALQPLELRTGQNPSVSAELQRNLLTEYFQSPAGFVPWQDQHV